MSFARSVQFTIKNGKVDEFNRLMHTEVLPLVKTENGFRQDLTVLDGNRGMSVSVWDDRACAERYNAKTYPEVLKKLDHVLDGTPRIETFESVLTNIPDVVHA